MKVKLIELDRFRSTGAINRHSVRAYTITVDGVANKKHARIDRSTDIEDKPFALGLVWFDSLINLPRQHTISNDLNVNSWAEAVAKSEGLMEYYTDLEE